ncbi:MAG TPA: putative toxin-antitoxin system toxin component, PIN family [Gaiellaceae bacterium]|nr:putative toxin-antitoxin system toxin component, PIN family [Gaiellaceae bacterium]
MGLSLPRVLCDTNVLVSALIASGPPSRVLEEAIDGRLELLIPVPVLDELDRVLAEKLGFDIHRVRDVRRLLEQIAPIQLALSDGANSMTGDRHDDVILACAVEADADILVTGDRKHLLPLGEHRGVRLLTPQALLAELRTQDS